MYQAPYAMASYKYIKLYIYHYIKLSQYSKKTTTKKNHRENYTNQVYSCPRDWRLLAQMDAQWKKKHPPETPRHDSFGGFWEGCPYNYAAMMKVYAIYIYTNIDI